MSPQTQERTERKYAFHEAAAEVLADWLEHCCLPDPAYPRGTVATLYYDTPRFDLYEEKANGDYRKCKVRLRWYEPAPSADVTCYLETKSREGALTRKSRETIHVAASRLADDPLSDDGIAELSGLSGAGGELVPMLLLRYERRRYVEPRSGARLSLDTGIRCDATNDAFLAASPPGGLTTGVLELKGRRREGEWVLRPLRGVLRPASFSKYAMCLRRVIDPGGRKDET